MECPWFFGADLYTAALLIAVLGIVHPAWWALAARRFRSEWFITLYVLAGGWCLVSCLLLAGVLAEVAVLYWVWIWFSLVFAPVMLVGMVVMLVGFCVLRMRTVAVCPAFGLFFYILVIYCICVVNTQRREMLRACCAEGRAGARAAARTHTRALRGASLKPSGAPATTATTALLTPTVKPPRRGYCALPARNPAHGVYMAALPSNRVAQPGRGYRRLRLVLHCDQFYRPRHLQYAFCYSGGWNLPLPDCVRDSSYYEEYYENYNPETTTAAPKTMVCAVPEPPAHGYFMADAKVTKRYMRLGVRCNALHYLVGWQRVTCRDGVWDRPVPRCVFVDSTVCTLLKSDAKLSRTCLAGPLYAAPYRCDAGLAPHGTVVEPRCRRDHYVWGSFSYLYCVNGIWHPKLLANNITCEYAADIFRHYEIEALKKTTTTTVPPIHYDYEDPTPANGTVNGTANSTAENDTRPGGRHGALGDPSRPHSTQTTNNTTLTGIWKIQTEAEDFLSLNLTKIDIWKSESESNNVLTTTSKNTVINNSERKRGKWPTSRQGSATHKNKNITEILKARKEAEKIQDDNSIETSIWKPLIAAEAVANGVIEAHQEQLGGAAADGRAAEREAWMSPRDRDWFGAGAAESQIEDDVLFDDNFIKMDIGTPRIIEVEEATSTVTTVASIWKSSEPGRADGWKPGSAPGFSRTISYKTTRRKSRKKVGKWLGAHSNTRRNTKARRSRKIPLSNITNNELEAIKLSG